jgi:hypothetical protein
MVPLESAPQELSNECMVISVGFDNPKYFGQFLCPPSVTEVNISRLIVNNAFAKPLKWDSQVPLTNAINQR